VGSLLDTSSAELFLEIVEEGPSALVMEIGSRSEVGFLGQGFSVSAIFFLKMRYSLPKLGCVS